MFMCNRGIDFAFVFDFCDWILELFRMCSIFWFFISTIDFAYVYDFSDWIVDILSLGISISSLSTIVPNGFWNYFDSVVNFGGFSFEISTLPFYDFSNKIWNCSLKIFLLFIGDIDFLSVYDFSD